MIFVDSKRGYFGGNNNLHYFKQAGVHIERILKVSVTKLTNTTMDPHWTAVQ